MNDGPVGVITRSEVVALLGRIPRLGIWLNHLSKEQGQCPWAEEPPHEAGQLGAAPPPCCHVPGLGAWPSERGSLTVSVIPILPFSSPG